MAATAAGIALTMPVSLAQPGMFGELIPHLRYEVMKSGAGR